jgi:hypothetical protein
MRLRALLVVLVLAAPALLPTAASASYWGSFVIEVGPQISLLNGSCTPVNGDNTHLSCTGSVTFADQYGHCDYSISRSTNPFSGYTYTFNAYNPTCLYHWTGQSSIKVIARTSPPAPTPTPFVPHTPAPTPTHAPTPPPSILRLTVESPLGYVSGPCTANPWTPGPLAGPPTYRCAASGSITVSTPPKATCVFAVVSPVANGGAWSVTKSGTCTFALKNGNQLDLRPH